MYNIRREDPRRNRFDQPGRADPAPRVGIDKPLPVVVRDWALMAQKAAQDGVIASPHEIGPIRGGLWFGFFNRYSGVRPAGAQLNDQRRVMTPV
jgi:orotidine-5'-phosphate decarboxylase